MTLVYNCGLTPVIILTKADLHQDPKPFVSEVETVAYGVPIHLVSAWDDLGLAALESYVSLGRTATMVGSSASRSKIPMTVPPRSYTPRKTASPGKLLRF